MSSTRQHSPELSSTSRKRVGKACDRCRLKKSKCDGALPCQRCIADDQICVFSERKRSKDKTYPKGYVELLESRNQVLAEALHKVLYCHQHNIDTTTLYPRDGKIVLNEVLGQLETFKGLPSTFKPAKYIDDALEHFEEEHDMSPRERQSSECSSVPSARTSLDLSIGSSGSPATPDFTFDGRYLTQPSKTSIPYGFDQTGGLPMSISPSLLMPDFQYSQAALSFDTAFTMSDPLMMDTDWL
ncbi:Fluconazole resistance protein 1 [Orbilia brochopaga]|uniref:Fluconazole resistance protein 1 n=1 Tax=Orbilia brochopaga TaxID=3140254 RepID=A0AAV9VC96_9PEZI